VVSVVQKDTDVDDQLLIAFATKRKIIAAGMTGKAKVQCKRCLANYSAFASQKFDAIKRLTTEELA